MDFDREKIYQLIYKENWNELIKLLHVQGKIITNCADEITINAIQTFIKQFINEFDKKNSTDYADQLYMIYSLHVTDVFKLSNEDFDSIVLKLVYIHENDLEEAVRYARRSPNNKTCAGIIRRYEESLPKIIKHSQNQKINVTSQANISDIDHTISLFKSSTQ